MGNCSEYYWLKKFEMSLSLLRFQWNSRKIIKKASIFCRFSTLIQQMNISRDRPALHAVIKDKDDIVRGLCWCRFVYIVRCMAACNAFFNNLWYYFSCFVLVVTAQKKNKQQKPSLKSQSDRQRRGARTYFNAPFVFAPALSYSWV